MIDQECILKIGEKLLFSTKNRTALPISAQATKSVRTYTKAQRNARILSTHEKLVEIVIKEENSTLLCSTEGLIDDIQETKEKKWITGS